MKITKEELYHFMSKRENPIGYRLVYFYENKYYIGEYSRTLEGFMLGFCESYPIMDDSDIPEFTSIEDILDRSLKDVKEAKKIAIYDLNGNLISQKERPVKNNH